MYSLVQIKMLRRLRTISASWATQQCIQCAAYPQQPAVEGLFPLSALLDQKCHQQPAQNQARAMPSGQRLGGKRSRPAQSWAGCAQLRSRCPGLLLL